jgi:hypothetical protein
MRQWTKSETCVRQSARSLRVHWAPSSACGNCQCHCPFSHSRQSTGGQLPVGKARTKGRRRRSASSSGGTGCVVALPPSSCEVRGHCCERETKSGDRPFGPSRDSCSSQSTPRPRGVRLDAPPLCSWEASDGLPPESAWVLPPAPSKWTERAQCHRGDRPVAKGDGMLTRGLRITLESRKGGLDRARRFHKHREVEQGVVTWLRTIELKQSTSVPPREREGERKRVERETGACGLCLIAASV